MAFQNFFAAKLFTDIGSSDVTITLDTAPTATSGRMVLEARNPTQREVIKYTGVSGNQLTGVTRGQGGTTAKSHLKNSLIEMNATAEDLQDLYDAFASFSATANDWRTLAPAVTAVSYLGNRSYQVTFASTIAALVSAGMRWRSTRTVLAPNQSATFNGTTQFYNKAAPAGMAGTDNYTWMGHIKLPAFPASASYTLMARMNTAGVMTDGWKIYIMATGQVGVLIRNGGAANYRFIISRHAIPMNKKFHLAVTWAAGVVNMYLDGLPIVTEAAASAGTNPTAWTNAGDYTIGRGNSTEAEYTTGTLAQMAVFSSVLSAATIRSYASQGLLGTEPNLVSAHSLSNSVNDLNTTNANNLTANGGVVATTADSPFGTQADNSISTTLDYGIVQSVTTTTAIIQVPEGCAIPTTGGVSASAYSGVKSPFAFPTQKSKWTLIMMDMNERTQASPVIGTWYHVGGMYLTVPIGDWDVEYGIQCGTARGANGRVDGSATLSTSTSVESDPELTSGFGIGDITYHSERLTGQKRINFAAQTNLNLLGRAGQAGETTIFFENQSVIGSPEIIRATNALL